MEAVAEGEQKVNLKQTIGLGTGIALIVGGILDPGIFVPPQEVVIGVGSYGLSFQVWIHCALLSLCGALTYAELGSLLPKSGSAYYYLYEVFVEGTVFLNIFTAVLVILPDVVVITARICAEYLTTLTFADQYGSAPNHINKTLALLIILTVMLVSLWRVRNSGKMAEFFTIGNIIALIIIIVGGIYMISKVLEYLKQPLELQRESTVLWAMWAFAGWLVFVATREEHMPSILSMHRVHLLTPAPTIVFLCLLSVANLFMGTVIDLIHYTGVVVWIFHFLMATALFILRIEWKDTKRPYKVPIVCPVVLLVSSVLPSISPIVRNSVMGYIFAVSVVFIGILVSSSYQISSHKNKTRYNNSFLQLLCNITNEEYEVFSRGNPLHH